MDQFSLDHLSDVEFEQYCFDLLQDLGFTSMSWRKGTGLNSSPADSGRDIECSLLQHRVDGEKYFEKWFVDCKHYQKGVPGEALLGALSWAQAERPDILLIITSNFLSNSAKDQLERYKEKNKPAFKIVCWERPKLEKLTSTRSKLLQKYRISGNFPFLALMHPTHIACLQEMPLNTLKYLFDCMDDLSSEKRDSIFGMIYDFIIRPRSRKPITGKETMKELLIDRVDYPAFKGQCYRIIETGLISDTMLAYLIVSFTLEFLFQLADTTSIDKGVARMVEAAEFFKSQIEKRPQDRDQLLKMVENSEKHRIEMPTRIAANYELYTYFCEQILEKLRLEKYLWTYKVSEDEQEEYDDAVQFYRDKKIQSPNKH